MPQDNHLICTNVPSCTDVPSARCKSKELPDCCKYEELPVCRVATGRDRLLEHNNLLTISIGSNTPDRSDKIAAALRGLARFVTIDKVSDPYDSPDYNALGDSYINILVLARTGLTVDIINEKIKTIETALGRTPQSKPSGVMPVDIDIVICDGLVLDPVEYSRPHFQHLLKTL